jgi:hypothetical protein
MHLQGCETVWLESWIQIVHKIKAIVFQGNKNCFLNRHLSFSLLFASSVFHQNTNEFSPGCPGGGGVEHLFKNGPLTARTL